MDKGLETSKISSSGDPTGRTLHPATGQTVAKVLVTDLCTESQSNDISEVQALIEENKVLKAQFRELKKDSERGMGTRRNLAEENDCVQFQEKEEEKLHEGEGNGMATRSTVSETASETSTCINSAAQKGTGTRKNLAEENDCVQFREKEKEEEEELLKGEGNGMATRSTVSETASETSTCINSAAQKGTGTRKNLAEENDCVQFREKEKEEEEDKLLKGEECGTIDSATQKEMRTRKNSPEEHDCVLWKQNLKGETVHKKDVEASRMRIPSEEAMSDCRTEDEVRNRKKEFKRVNPDIRTAEGNEVHGQKLGNRSSKVQYSDLKLDMIVGKGAFGEVWKGNLGCIEVAVKKPRKISSDVQKLFEQEFKIISQLEHPNVVTFIAVVVDVDGPPWIVLEYGNRGSLQKLLKERLLRPFEVFSFAHDAGCGLSYLHSRLPVPILHRDIHPGNLLLFEFNTPPGEKLKLCDFGNGRSWGSIMTPDLGAPHLNAPETRTHQYTTKAEVYRFGWVLFNMLRKSEWPDCEELKRQVQEELPQLINWCREQDADLRPNMQAVVKELKKMKEHYITFRGQVERNPVEKYVITETSFNGH